LARAIRIARRHGAASAPQLRLRIDTMRAAGSGFSATFALPLVSTSK
jgi:hypothetical protein